jgi:dolichol-phosphate mannosyltransferase
MPKLSVVISAYNEEHSLVRCIERVLAIANADLELEVLVVDDASTDSTLKYAQDLGSCTHRGASSDTR